MEIAEPLNNIEDSLCAYKPPPFCERGQAERRKGWCADGRQAIAQRRGSGTAYDKRQRRAHTVAAHPEMFELVSDKDDKDTSAPPP
jgi:hypothetical protein